MACRIGGAGELRFDPALHVGGMILRIVIDTGMAGVVALCCHPDGQARRLSSVAIVHFR
jgi:hypothetical protein